MDRFLWIAATLGLGLYGQLVTKWRAEMHSGRASGDERFGYVLAMLTDPWVISGLAGAFLASIAYMLALEKLPLSYAYPLMALSFVIVPVAAVLIFGGRIPLMQALGLGFIVLGVSLSAMAK